MRPKVRASAETEPSQLPELSEIPEIPTRIYETTPPPAPVTPPNIIENPRRRTWLWALPIVLGVLAFLVGVFAFPKEDPLPPPTSVQAATTQSTSATAPASLVVKPDLSKEDPICDKLRSSWPKGLQVGKCQASQAQTIVVEMKVNAKNKIDYVYVVSDSESGSHCLEGYIEKANLVGKPAAGTYHCTVMIEP
jgi:hypothetical protein